MRPEIGVYENMPFSDYARWQAASNSQLSRLARSPAHLRAYLDGGDEDYPHLVLGRAVHCCVLEPDRWPTDYVRAIDGDGRTKAVKEAREAQRAEHPRATVISGRDYDTCEAIRASVLEHPAAREMLVGGKPEVSLAWDDEGVRCKGRLDMLQPLAIVDLKTTEDASPEAFARSVHKYGYHRQAAMYLRGAAMRGLCVDRFVFVAVEKAPPYAVAVYELDDQALTQGDHEVTALLAQYGECTESGVWPGYRTDVMELSLPSWARKKVEVEW